MRAIKTPTLSWRFNSYQSSLVYLTFCTWMTACFALIGCATTEDAGGVTRDRSAASVDAYVGEDFHLNSPPPVRGKPKKSEFFLKHCGLDEKKGLGLHSSYQCDYSL